jgi:hypothetical protein
MNEHWDHGIPPQSLLSESYLAEFQNVVRELPNSNSSPSPSPRTFWPVLACGLSVHMRIQVEHRSWRPFLTSDSKGSQYKLSSRTWSTITGNSNCVPLVVTLANIHSQD